jgi:RNA polymerase sigma-70 factor (family 1)
MVKMSDFFFRLFKANYHNLHRFFMVRLGSVQEAEDAAQETFTRMMAHHDNIVALRSPRSYLFRIARNLVTDLLRARNTRLKYTTSVDIEEQVAPVKTPEEAVDSRERQKLVQKALAELPPRCREVFILHRLENLTYRQIATQLDISPRTVEHHVANAVFHLRKAFSRDDS